MVMNVIELGQLQKRVEHLHLCNHILHQNIYGNFILDRFDSTLGTLCAVQKSEVHSTDFPSRLYAQYLATMHIAKSIEIPNARPATAKGSRVLQPYHSRVHQMTHCYQSCKATSGVSSRDFFQLPENSRGMSSLRAWR